MVTEQQKKEFLSRKLDNWDWIKTIEKVDLLEQIYDTLGGHTFKMKPYLHQMACFYLGTYIPNFLFYLDPGTGKSSIALSLITYFKNKGNIKRSLVLVPYSIAVESWAEQVEIHSNLSYKPLIGSSIQKWEQLNNSTDDIIGLSYPGLVAMVTDKGLVRKKYKLVSGMVINTKKLYDLIEKFDCVIYDEIHFLKGFHTISAEICCHISNGCKYRYGLTGTPFGRDLQDLWSQFYLMDFGNTLGKNISFYRDIFFKSKPAYFGGYDYVIKKELKPILSNIIKNISIRYEENEVNELPLKVSIKKYFTLGKQAKDLYKQILNEVKDSNWQFKEVKNVYLRMRQICSGFIKLTTEAGEEVEIVFDENPKLEGLIELIKEAPEDEKFVVFNDYTKTGDIICERLQKEKIGYTRLYSGTEDKGEGLHKFKKDKNCRIYVINSASGSMSLNLQNSRYIIFFECPKVINRLQASKRVHRTGQTRRVFEYDFIIKNTGEEKLLNYIIEGKDLYDEILNNKDKKTLLSLFE